jgi:DNA-binding transcriptional ArsR family regulator
MTVALAEDRLRRLVNSGLRGTCRPSERLLQLKRRAEQIDNLTNKRREQLFFGLADKTRLMVLELLTDEELCSCEIMAALDLTEPTTSHHLGILERAGLVVSRRDGKWVFYRLASPNVKALLAKGTSIVKGAI